MPNMQEILAQHRQMHDALGKQSEASNKAQFDLAHGNMWIACSNMLTARLTALENRPAPSAEELTEIDEIRAYLSIPLEASP